MSRFIPLNVSITSPYTWFKVRGRLVHETIETVHRTPGNMGYPALYHHETKVTSAGRADRITSKRFNFVAFFKDTLTDSVERVFLDASSEPSYVDDVLNRYPLTEVQRDDISRLRKYCSLNAEQLARLEAENVARLARIEESQRHNGEQATVRAFNETLQAEREKQALAKIGSDTKGVKAPK